MTSKQQSKSDADNLFVKKIIKFTGIFVSVGSGMGVMEKQLLDAGKVVICVDPNNYDKKDRYTQAIRVIQPNYRFVSDLLEDKPSIVGKVNLILNHPLPDYALYDIMAILKLEPIRIFLYYMKEGGAGTWLLHRFLRKNGVNNTGKLKTDYQLETNYKISIDVCPVIYRYKQIYENDIQGRSPSEGDHSYCILEREEKLPKKYISINCEANLSDKEEFILIGKDHTRNEFVNCVTYLSSLHLYTPIPPF